MIAQYTRNPTDEELIEAEVSMGKSIAERMIDKIQKASPSAAFKKPEKAPSIPRGMKFGGGGGPAKLREQLKTGKVKPPQTQAMKRDKPAAGAVQGSVVKPPAGFTPIPHSKKGGYHKQMGGGKFMYWYPGQGIVGEKHEADSEATPHQEETAKHVMEQIAKLEQKGSITRQELEHTQTAIRNAWPKGPQDVPRHIMEHYHTLQGMVSGAEGPAAEEPAAAEKPPKEPEVPEVKIRRPGEELKTAKQVKTESDVAKIKRKIKTEVRAQQKEEKRKAARKAVLTDPKKVPENFNKLPKMERAKLTANWDQVKDDLDANYPKGDYMAHSDMRQAITEHIDEMADAGHIVPANTGRAKGMLLKQLEYGEKAGIKKEALAALLEENIRKLAHQEVESVKRTLGDHGVRHLEVNAHQANRIFDQLEKGGVKVSPMDRFMTHQVMLDHDMGYTIPVIAKGGFKIKDNYHPQASAVLASQQGAKYRKLFGAKGFKEFQRHIETHSGSAVDWKNDPVGSTVRLADNTHLFADKLPEVLFDTNAGVEVLTKIKLADQVVPKSLETVDDSGNTVMKRTPEEKAEFKALIGGIKGQLADAIKGRGDLPKRTKELLANAVNEIGALTPKFLISRLAGREPKFEYSKKTGNMGVNVEQSPARQAIGEIFGDDETDKQFTKMLEDFGTSPKDAMEKKPPPPGVHIGEKNNGIDFAWKPPTGEHPAERRYAKVMRDTRARLSEIQAMKGSAKSAALKRFFGDDLSKAIDALINAWTLEQGLDELRKASAMSALATRTGRVRPSPYAAGPAGPTIKERIGAAMGRRPKGTGWTSVPGGKKGGYRKMVGGRWSYWYPGMGAAGGSQQEAERHHAKKEIAHHESQVAKWQKRYSRHLDQGRTKDAKAALERRHHHQTQAAQLREKHGIRKSEQMNKTMTTKRGEELHFRELEARIRAGTRGAKPGTKTAQDPAAVAAKVYRQAGGVPSPRKKKEKSMDKGYEADGTATSKGVGEGSRGGKVIGHTPAGKPIYGSHSPGHAVMGHRHLSDKDLASAKKRLAADYEESGKEGHRQMYEQLHHEEQRRKTSAVKSVMVGTCQVHLSPDEALSKSLEDGELGIGTVPRTFSSKTMKKAVGGEGASERGGDQREAVARAQQDAEIVRMDPAGNDGNGGLPEWFADARRTQEPAVRAPAMMSKAQDPPTRVIDDDDPYTRRLHQMDPRDGAANVDFAYNRDAKRTQ